MYQCLGFRLQPHEGQAEGRGYYYGNNKQEHAALIGI